MSRLSTIGFFYIMALTTSRFTANEPWRVHCVHTRAKSWIKCKPSTKMHVADSNRSLAAHVFLCHQKVCTCKLVSRHASRAPQTHLAACCCSLAAACCAVFRPEALRGVVPDAAAADDVALPLLPFGAAAQVAWVPFSPCIPKHTFDGQQQHAAMCAFCILQHV